MVELSVGEVSGFIAAAVFALQLFLPLALPAILIAFISEENSAVTWSVLGRNLHSSFWPSILSTDTAAVTGVRRNVSITGWFQTAALLLVTVASILTPLGLYDSIEPAKTQTAKPFNYIKDDSAFGYGTPERADAPFTRFCGDRLACPGSTRNETCHKVGSSNKCTLRYDTSIPEALRDLFRNGVKNFGPSISSLFDIQWRTYRNGTDQFSIAGWYLRSGYQQLSVLILDESTKVVEGLLVDTASGGIGFRNHTVPSSSLKYGSTWNEDILFIQPETQCVGLNLTLDFKLPIDETSDFYADDLVLTDRGGFSVLSRTRPNLKIPPNGQGDLKLKERAFKAAWLNNFLTMAYFNVTDPDWANISRIDVKEGEAFPISSSISSTTFRVGYSTIRSNMEFGEYLNLTNNFNRNISNTKNNPFGISSDSFSFITNVCAGSTSSSAANINSSVVGCSLLYGAGNRTDGGSSLVADPGSQWSVPIYSCASAIKATIKTVIFQYNGTGIEALKVKEIKPKTYKGSSNHPLWAVEDLKSMTLADTQPLWGLIGTSNSTGAPASPYSISTVSGESLYLPGHVELISMPINGLAPVPLYSRQNLPGVDFYAQALMSALGIDRPGGTGYQGYADYSGQSSLALYAKWRRLSESADKAAKIIDLVWTDVAANAVVGTKGWGLTSAASVQPNAVRRRSDDDNDAQQNMISITTYEKHIRYRLLFAIPAFITLATTIAVLCTFSALIIMRRTGPARMHRFLEATSVGRILGAALWPDKEMRLGTTEWIASVGMRNVRITSEGVLAEGESLMNELDEDAVSEHGEDATPMVNPTTIGNTEIVNTDERDGQITREIEGRR